jgi:hypothetical protein
MIAALEQLPYSQLRYLFEQWNNHFSKAEYAQQRELIYFLKGACCLASDNEMRKELVFLWEMVVRHAGYSVHCEGVA